MSRSLFHGLQYSGLTEDERALALHFDEFVRRHKLDSLAFEIDKTGVIPPTLLQAFRDSGFFGLPIPVEYGGFGGTFVASSLFGKHIGGSCFAIGNVIGVHAALCSLPISVFGTEEQKQHYLPRLASGEWTGAFAVTEPTAGANLEYTSCTGRPDSDGYVIDGVKRYISNGPTASLALALVRTGTARAGKNGLSFFLMESSEAGFSVGQVFDPKMGGAGALISELVFEGVRARPSQLLGGVEGQGWDQLQSTLENSRMVLSSLCLGMAHGALEASIDHVVSRAVGTPPRATTLSEFEAVQGTVTDMAATVVAMEAVVFETARRIDASTNLGRLATMTKVFCSQSLGDLLREARMIHGGASYLRGNLIERLSREQPVSEIYEGSNVLSQILVAGELSSRDGMVMFVEDADLGPFVTSIKELRATLRAAYETVRANKVRRHQTPSMALGEATTLLYAAECAAKDSHAAAARGASLGEIREQLAACFCARVQRRLHSCAEQLSVFDRTASDEQERVSRALVAAVET